MGLGDNAAELQAFWDILAGILMDKHKKKPVHTVRELQLLQSRFPDKIKLHVVRDGSEVVAGIMVYDMGHVVHAQYIASSEKGKKSGALDLLIHNLITEVYADRTYFDFGVSTENGGGYLNEGLIFQKEGFGARSVVYDTYEMLF